MSLLCIRANKPYINNKVAYLAKWCSCLALLAGMHILTATPLTVLSWPQIPSVFLLQPSQYYRYQRKWALQCHVLSIWSISFSL